MKSGSVGHHTFIHWMQGSTLLAVELQMEVILMLCSFFCLSYQSHLFYLLLLGRPLGVDCCTVMKQSTKSFTEYC